jgi:hypothetical protein
MGRPRFAVALLSVTAVACGSSSSGAGGDGGGQDAPSNTRDSGSGTTDAGHRDAAAPPTGDAGHHGDAGGPAGTLLTCTSSAATTTVDAGAVPAPGVVTGMVPGPGTFVGGCQIFPPTNAWNVDVSSSSIATTTAYAISAAHLHPDLGDWTPDAYGIPFSVVPASQPLASITFTAYASQSDPGPNGWTQNPNTSSSGNGVTAYPIPNGAHIEGNPPTGQVPGDDHLLVLQQGATCGAPCSLWEVGGTVGGSSAPWSAGTGAMWDLASNGLRPLGWTSADAAGLSLFAGLLKISEVKAGVVTHAVRVTFNTTQQGYVYPATHSAGSEALGSSAPPMGLRLRLKSTFDTSGFSGPGKIVAKAMQTYGLIVADNGSDWFFQGDSDNAWNDQDVTDTYVGELLTDFDGVHGTDFDVLDTGSPLNTGE